MRTRNLRRLLATAAAALALVGLSLTAAFGNVIHHGDGTLGAARLYLDFWGPQWSTGFSTDHGAYTSEEYQTYVEDFLNEITADQGPYSPLGQYGLTGKITYAGTWTDTSNSPPTEPSTDDLQTEVEAAAQHFGDDFGDQTKQDIIIIAMPSGHNPARFASNGGPACAWHNYAQYSTATEESTGVGNTPYIALPYQVDANNCWANVVNATDDGFGNGYFDGVSHALFHEISETVTDYDLSTGWYDSQGNEIGDLCQPYSSDFGQPGSGKYFAIQGVWSNADNGCNLTLKPTTSLTGTVNFGSQTIFSPSTVHTVTATNTGDGSMTLPSDPWGTIGSGEFSLTDNTCTTGTLAPSQSCHVKVQFAPRALGTASMLLVFIADEVTALKGITVTGTGSLRDLVAGMNVPATFGVALMHSHGVPRIITLTNHSGHALTLRPAHVTGLDAADFTIARDACGEKRLPARASCSIRLLFTAQATGALRAELVVPSSAGPIAAVLYGTGHGPTAAVSGAGLFDNMLNVGTADGLGEHPSQTVTLTARGQEPLRVDEVRVTGPFTELSKCPRLLPIGHSCAIRVTLRAKAYDFQQGALTIFDNAAPARDMIRLGADVEGTWADAVPGLLDFGQIPVGVTTTLPVSLQIGEGSAFSVGAVTATGGFTVDNHCPARLEAPSCTIDVSITPSPAVGGGERTGVLTIHTGAMNGTVQVSLEALVG
jgi:hypothetical protein